MSGLFGEGRQALGALDRAVQWQYEAAGAAAAHSAGGSAAAAARVHADSELLPLQRRAIVLVAAAHLAATAGRRERSVRPEAAAASAGRDGEEPEEPARREESVFAGGAGGAVRDDRGYGEGGGCVLGERAAERGELVVLPLGGRERTDQAREGQGAAALPSQRAASGDFARGAHERSERSA